VTVFHRPDVTQRNAEERHQLILVPPGHHRAEDLIEVQIAEHRRVVTFAPVRRAVKQDAAERRCRIHAHLHRHIVRQKPSAIVGGYRRASSPVSILPHRC